MANRLLFYIFVFLFCCIPLSQVSAQKGPTLKIDAILVLDNSGSMKKNDPNFLAKKSVLAFIKALSGDTRLGIVIFSDKSELHLPLTSISDVKFSTEVEKALAKLDYRGRLTDIPGGVERGLYELKQKSRPDALKAIILMTDGIVDLGDPGKNKERTMWLKEVLLQGAKDNNIYIFGIAFTEEADFALIQTIAQKTEADYYRALTPEELQGVFEKLRSDIAKKVAKPETKVVTSAKATSNWIYVLGAIIVCAGIAIGAYFILKKKPLAKEVPIVEKPEIGETERIENIPEAYLRSNDPRIGSINYRITKQQTIIGREPGVDIQINQPTVSRIHARIVYENGAFYLVDAGSTNGTFIKNEKLEPREKYRLYGGEEIFLDKNNKFRFLFVISGVSPEEIREGVTQIIDKPGIGVKPSIEPKKEILPGPVETLPDVKSEEKKDETYTGPQESFEEEISTIHKEAMCKFHPSRKNVGICAVCGKEGCELCILVCSFCGKSFCRDHIKERDGTHYCEKCFSKF